jgi:predicted enzyme related to lactoylglutathione lyase
MRRVVHFEICVHDPEQAVIFYGNSFGWKIDALQAPAEYWLVTTGEAPGAGINGGIMRSEGPFKGTINTIAVEDIDEVSERILQAGGLVVQAKHAIGGIGYQAYFTDPEGNLFGIHQEDSGATSPEQPPSPGEAN